jgi:hypothetical protein
LEFEKRRPDVRNLGAFFHAAITLTGNNEDNCNKRAGTYKPSRGEWLPR